MTDKNELYALLLSYIVTSLEAGKPREEMVQFLEERGLPKDSAIELIEFVINMKQTDPDLIENSSLVSKTKTLNDINQYNVNSNSINYQHSREDLERAKRGYKKMMRGIVLLLIGGTITGVTYLISSRQGGQYVLCYGALIFGAIYAFTGFIEWKSNG